MKIFGSDHEHDWEEFPPSTAGGTGVAHCKSCGMYDVIKDPKSSILIEPPFYDVRRSTTGTSDGSH